MTSAVPARPHPKNLPSGALGAAIAILGLFLTLPCAGMDRFDALAMLESGGNDRAIGKAGEISRFQVLPAVWAATTTVPANRACVPADALLVAKSIMSRRIAHFQRQFHRQPTDFEWYCLWTRPSEIARPSKAVSERAIRFQNLRAKR